MFGHIVTDADECVFLHLCLDVLMREHRLRMDGGAVLALFNIDRAVDERDRLARTKSVAAEVAQLFAAAQFCLLWWKAVAMDRRFCSSANRFHESETRQSSAFIEQVLR